MQNNKNGLIVKKLFENIILKISGKFPEIKHTTIYSGEKNISFADGNSNYIYIDKNLEKKEIEQTILHELSHIIEYKTHKTYSGHNHIFNNILTSLRAEWSK